jgi:cell division protein FtsQ
MHWKSKIWKITLLTFWCLAGAGMIALLVAAVSKKNHEVCKGYEIRIHGASEQLFLEQADIVELLAANSTIQGRPVEELDLRRMEEQLERHAWIRSAQLFVDNRGILKIAVEEREPIARIFTLSGNSFYIDSACEQLPLTDKIAVRLPVFTGFPSDREKLNKADKQLMRQVKAISEYINKHAFWNAQVNQVDITPQRNFEMVPMVGNHVIEFGDGNNVEDKFRRLMVFYQQVMSKMGLNGYEKVSVQFARQVVGKKKEARISRYDSLMAVKKIQQLIVAAQRLQPDTLQPAKMKPLETGNISEHQLKNYDLVPGDTVRRETSDVRRETSDGKSTVQPVNASRLPPAASRQTNNQ